MKQLNFSSVILVKILLESVNGDFPAYWNVVNRCYRKYGIVPDLDRYGIIHNDDYELTGNKVSNDTKIVQGIFKGKTNFKWLCTTVDIATGKIHEKYQLRGGRNTM